MIEHVSSGRMHDAIDGLLSTAEIDQIEAHVTECAPCREHYARLSEATASIRALPRSASVPEDAWPGIARRLESVSHTDGDDEAKVLRLPTGAASQTVRRLTFTVPQLAAAAIVVSVLSATTVWMAIGDTGPSESTFASASPTSGGAAARAVSTAGSRYVEVVDQLEAILDEGRGVLAPQTLVTIEESLGTVDAAIAEIETALAEDPNSDLLLRMLANHQRTKLGVLQRAAAAVQAQT